MMRTTAAAVVMMTVVAGGALAQPGQAGAGRTARPQEPVGAVRYRVEAVTVEVLADEAGDVAHTLAGTVTDSQSGVRDRCLRKVWAGRIRPSTTQECIR